MSRQYITTAIDYPNALPHMGHVLEKVLADVYVRWRRLKGDTVRFQIGADEHGVKIQRTAERQGMTPLALVDRNVPFFRELYTNLGISYDVFLRTSDQKRHWPTVLALWERLLKAGALEKRAYKGLYCSGCERFVTKKELTEDGRCPDHGAKPEEVEEENWFFLLSREEEWLSDLLTKKREDGGYEIVPSFRRPEVLSLIEQGLSDVSFSRPRSSLSWGIPVPGDEEHTMYVWCDALTNYLSGLSYFTDKEDRSFWEEAEVTHVIGKDIARFHALYWPAMLKNAGVRSPDRLLIHGFLTSDGQKMSKTLGNVVQPTDILDRCGGNGDPLRFYLSHEIPVGRDGDFSWERFEALYNAKLRNEIGNLLHRVLVLLEKEGGTLSFHAVQSRAERWRAFEESMNSFAFSKALEISLQLIDEGNRLMNEKQPWKQPKEEKTGILCDIAELLRHSALMLLPFIPETAARISGQLGVPYAGRMLQKEFVLTPDLQEWGTMRESWNMIGHPSILFAPLG